MEAPIDQNIHGKICNNGKSTDVRRAQPTESLVRVEYELKVAVRLSGKVRALPPGDVYTRVWIDI